MSKKGIKHYKNPEDAFWARTTVLGSDDCWNWTGAIESKGYGQIQVNGRLEMSHRFSYILHKGSISKEYVVDHTCHNMDKNCKGGPSCHHRRCMNPNHLELVSNQENLNRSHNTNKNKTHCPRGHIYDGVSTRGDRWCITCDKIRKGKNHD